MFFVRKKIMKRNLAILSFVFCAVSTFAFFNFSTARAQTAAPSRQRQAPTPTPVTAPTVKPTVSPSVSPTPEVEETIKIDTELVNLNVRVVDRNNRPINNLSQKEFQIYEDGVAQPIEFFSKSEVPTNYTLVVDNSGSLRMQLEKVIEAGKILVNSNRPDDETSIIRFVSRDKIDLLQDFTSDKTELNDTLDNLFSEGGQTAIIDAVYLAAEKVTEYERNEKGNDRKRRALILVSDGEDRDSFYKEPQLFELLKESDVQIYVVGFVSELTKEGGFISKSPQAKAKAFLEKLATTTGGKSYFPNDVSELESIAKDISSELRTQYSIGYVPTNNRNDGSFRNIKVQVADGPNKQKRIAVTRAGRTASSDGSAPSLQNTKKQ
jgi:Ca-activated chloride channel family protein